MLQGGTVVNHDQQFEGDVLIQDGLIAEVAPRIEVGGGGGGREGGGAGPGPGGATRDATGRQGAARSGRFLA